MSGELFPFCVYTIVHVSELERVYAGGGVGSFTENKKWVGAARLLDEAAIAGQRLPVIFADAATTAGLIYYALLTEVAILGDSVRGPTRYSFDGLTIIRPPLPKGALIKLTGGQPLDDNYIRPYVLCYTPVSLLSSAVQKPVPGAKRNPVPTAGQQPAPETKPKRTKEPRPPKAAPPITPQVRTPQSVAPQRAGSKSKPPVYLFGYSGKTLEQIARALDDDGLLIDIRYSPRSRKAGFSRSGLERAFGNRYHHVRELGNIDYQSGGIRLADPETGLRTVEALAEVHGGRLFLMCACEDGAYCHRTEVGRLLKKRGYAVAEYDFTGLN